MRYDIDRMGELINWVAGQLLQQIVTGREWDKIKKLKVGETVTFPRDFGTMKPLKVTRVQ